MIEILDENDFFCIINKPAGISIHNESPSVQDFLVKLNKPAHFVNRIDQETSGLIVIAKKAELQAGLVDSLQLGKKYYRALLRGKLTSQNSNPQKSDSRNLNTTDEQKIIWTKPLSDKSEGRTLPEGKKSDQKPCETHVTILRQNQYFTEISAQILTGRQHQIRKHCCLAKHPIVGDKRYNDGKYNQKIDTLFKVSRMHLYAVELEFNFKNKNYSYKLDINLDHFFI